MNEPKQNTTADERTVERTGEPPLRFKAVDGWTDTNKTIKNNNRWTTVTVWRTTGGNYVAQVSTISCWEGEHDFHKAKALATPQEVIDYLKDDEGFLGRVSQGVIEQACKKDPAFASVFVEEVP